MGYLSHFLLAMLIARFATAVSTTMATTVPIEWPTPTTLDTTLPPSVTPQEQQILVATMTTRASTTVRVDEIEESGFNSGDESGRENGHKPPVLKNPRGVYFCLNAGETQGFYRQAKCNTPCYKPTIRLYRCCPPMIKDGFCDSTDALPSFQCGLPPPECPEQSICINNTEGTPCAAGPCLVGSCFLGQCLAGKQDPVGK